MEVLRIKEAKYFGIGSCPTLSQVNNVTTGYLGCS